MITSPHPTYDAVEAELKEQGIDRAAIMAVPSRLKNEPYDTDAAWERIVNAYDVQKISAAASEKRRRKQSRTA